MAGVSCYWLFAAGPGPSTTMADMRTSGNYRPLAINAPLPSQPPPARQRHVLGMGGSLGRWPGRRPTYCPWQCLNLTATP